MKRTGKIIKKYALSIIGLLILLIGTGMGVYLVQKNQNIREKAATVACIAPNTCYKYECSSGYSPATGVCSSGPEWVCCKPPLISCPSHMELINTSKPADPPNFTNCRCMGNWRNCNSVLSDGCETLTTNSVCSISDGSDCKNNYRGRCVDDNNHCDIEDLGRIDCPTGKVCVRESANCIAPVQCPSTDCNIPENTQGAVFCYLQDRKNYPIFCCPSSKPIYDTNKKACVTTISPPGGDKPKTPVPPKPSDANKPTTPPGEACGISYQINPSTFSGFSKSGELILFLDPGGYEFNIALKKNADTCSQTDNDVLLDTKNASDSKLSTGIQVVTGDKICVYAVGYDGTPGGGWIEPEGGKCQGPQGEPKDISALLAKAPEAVSVQCWGDVEIEDCDFNDFAFVFTVGEGTTVTGNGLKLRFQGITKKASDQLIFASFLSSGSSIWSDEEIEVINDDTGVYTMNIPTEVEAGTYDLLIKGPSHLQKRYTNIVYNGNNQAIDLSQTETYQCRAGDVNGDNSITIDDVAQVSQYYTDFAVTVSKSDLNMVASDINKDGKITIQDLALIAINWSDFKVEGDK